MGRLFWQISTTIDGFMEDTEGKLDLTAGFHDEDFERYASGMLESIGGFVIGRKTYDLFVDYWPTATGKDAENMNELPKYIVSRTLEKADWNNAELISENVPAAIKEIEQRSDRDIAVFGSAELASFLIGEGLIDEYRIFITPCFLGQGGRTFKDDLPRQELKLVRSESWSSGTTAQFYEKSK
jgi:dihydrofolate reductase